VSKRTYAVVWTWKKHRIVATKKRGIEVARVWKRWYERKGWRVRSLGQGLEGYLAYAPDYKYEDWNDHGPDSRVHVCSVHTYDAETKERIYPKPPTVREKREAVETVRRRRGRKPVAE
jgi:hypothetical protein